jgi:thioesterase domain-containing protein
VLFYRDLARYLGSDQPFYALQAQGLDGKQAPFTRVEDMAAHYIEEMRSLQPGGPYFIGGYCFGGLVAFEIARQLHAQGEKVALVALIDMNAPGYLKSLPNPRSYFDRFHRLRRKVELHLYNLSILGPEEKLRYLRGRLSWMAYRFYTGTGLPSVRARARRAILEAMRQAARSYNPDIYPGDVTLLRATELPPGRARDPQLGWGKLAAGGVEVRLIPGYFAHTILEPSVRDLAEQLKACMSQAQSTEFCAQSSNQVSQAVPAVKRLAVQAAIY